MNTSKKVQRSARDRMARLLDSGLPVLGVVIVLAAVVWGGGGWGPLWMAVAGLLLVEAGVWRLGSRLIHERRYTPLRREVQRFIALARDLHYANVSGSEGNDPAAREDTRDAALAALQASLDRIVAVAGKTEEDLQAGPAAVAAPAPAAMPDR